MLDKPRGGTELMYEELTKRLPEDTFSKFSIFNYPAYADIKKTTIYWNQLSYDQPIVQFLQNPEEVDKIDHFVFVSHWQAEQFRKAFNIPGYKTRVIKNAWRGTEQRKSGKRDKVKVCYTSTPWRGLDVLLEAWELLNPPNAELHIFSSTQIYGKDFEVNNDNLYQDLYDKCRNLEGIVYRGFVPNEELLKELPEFDILAYPNTFEETSCIAVIDALAAGLRVICPNLGALPETTEGWAQMYPYLMDKSRHASKFAGILRKEIKKIRNEELDEHLELQKQIYASRWSWDKRITEWTSFLNTLTPKGQLILEPTLETLPNNLPTDIQPVEQ
jgi:glycosyltransferase involved in cell wall biosynthesis